MILTDRMMWEHVSGADKVPGNDFTDLVLLRLGFEGRIGVHGTVKPRKAAQTEGNSQSHKGCRCMKDPGCWWRPGKSRSIEDGGGWIFPMNSENIWKAFNTKISCMCFFSSEGTIKGFRWGCFKSYAMYFYHS